MKKLYSELFGQPVFSRDTAGTVARIFDLVLDPSDGSLVALSVHPLTRKLIGSRDVISWYPRVTIRDMDSIVDPDDVVRIQRVLEAYAPVIRNRVITESGKELGTVYDYLFDLDTTIMLKIMVAHSFLGMFRFGDRIISAKNIVRIEPDQIIVKDDTRVREQAREAEMVGA